MTMNSRVRAIREAVRTMQVRHAVHASPETVCGGEAGTIAVVAYVGVVAATGAGASSGGVLAASVVDAVLIGIACGAIGTLFVQWLGTSAARVCRTAPSTAERSRGQVAGRS